MTKVSCEVPERFVNPLFEVFDGGDFILSSYRDIEKSAAEMRIFCERAEDAPAAGRALDAALAVVMGDQRPALAVEDVPDEDWRFAYRRHFQTERVSDRVYTVPEWEAERFFADGGCGEHAIAVVSDPGMAFGTGKHETTKACLRYIDEIAAAVSERISSVSFLDMGCGSGILSIAAAKFGFAPVEGFDVDEEAVSASVENAGRNGVTVSYRRFALGRARQTAPARTFDVVVANILGPLLIRFADEIVTYCRDELIISGILEGLYPEVLAAYVSRGFKEVSRLTIGEWTTGRLRYEKQCGTQGPGVEAPVG